MKKLMLTSLLAVFAVTAANAAVMDGNPLYRPAQGHFYSDSSLSAWTKKNAQARPYSKGMENLTLAEKFGYGITDDLAIAARTSVSGFAENSWNELGIEANYRVLNYNNWKADVYGKYGLAPVWGFHRPFFEADDTMYGWVAGARAGYDTGLWSVAGHVDYMYMNSESFNWGDEGARLLVAGADGFWNVWDSLSLLAGVEYTGVLDVPSYSLIRHDLGKWSGTLGVNYNLDETKYVGAYVLGEMYHGSDWKFTSGFGVGLKFGIDF